MEEGLLPIEAVERLKRATTGIKIQVPEKPKAAPGLKWDPATEKWIYEDEPCIAQVKAKPESKPVSEEKVGGKPDYIWCNKENGWVIC